MGRHGVGSKGRNSNTPAFLDQLERAQEQLRPQILRALRLGGAEDVRPLRGRNKAPLGLAPLIILACVAALSSFPLYTQIELGPHVRHGLGMSTTTFVLIQFIHILAIAGAAMLFASLFNETRARGAALGAIVIPIAIGSTAFVNAPWPLLGAFVVGAAGIGAVHAMHLPLIMDIYPADVRARGFFVHHVGLVSGQLVVAIILVVGLWQLSMTWRMIFLVVGYVAIIPALLAGRLPQPPVGGREQALVAASIPDRARPTRPAPVDGVADRRLAAGEAIKRVLSTRAARRLLTTNAAVGFLGFPLVVVVSELLEQRWRLGPSPRAWFFGAIALVAVGAMAVASRRVEEMFGRSPQATIRTSAALLGGAAVAFGLGAFVPWLFGALVLFAVVVAAAAVLSPILDLTLLSILPAEVRGYASALAGIARVVGGAFGGLGVVDAFASRFGLDIGMAVLAISVLHVSRVLSKKAPAELDEALDRLSDQFLAEEHARGIARRGSRLPMLTCRNIDFAYGNLQVLFDVSFAVDDGEMVALLGTNGAGKSTLLRVISGLGLPTRGSVRFDQTDITYWEPERRVGTGISQIPGGRAVFGPLTVVENLRLFGFSHGRRRAAVVAGIEAAFAAFPVLETRRDQAAATLSGGEQQMLGLAQALIVRPRLLLIDELSLGLAPKIVGELLTIVRRINEEGTAVVLVEQSVSVALSLAEHAYFMEKGEVRFDGAARDLLTRGDLLRSVFLEGATKGLATPRRRPRG